MEKTNGREIEVFTAGCYLCAETMDIVNQAVCDGCTVTERNINAECGCGCIDKAREYGVRTIPTIVVDGEIAIEGRPTVDSVRETLGM
jgi:hypothetical protein